MLIAMSTSIAPPPTREAPIHSIQPGGGFCFGLERAWARLRRATLRRFFPGYVQRQASLRQGLCPDCPHDIIDSRDLKHVRNVCGYRFPPESDPFSWRDHLGFARAGFTEILCVNLLLVPLMLLGGALALTLHPAFWAVPLLLTPFWLFTFAFFRDPHRVIPDDPNALVSPADGVITHLEEVDEPGFTSGKAFRVSIFLSVFNVHVNRMSRAGIVRRVAYYPGEFLDARAGDCPVRNEQLWLDLEDARLHCPIRIKQIAGAIARRIVCWVAVGESIAAGERFGMIKFGSRTEVLIPADRVASIPVQIGQAVRGGSDVLLILRTPDQSPVPSSPSSGGN